MSQSTNPDKYGDLLNKFLEGDNQWEKNDSEQMERWLNEATNNIRSRFQSHRGKTMSKCLLFTRKCVYLGDLLQSSDHRNEDEVFSNYTNHLEAAMCVSLPSDSSDDDEPPQKNEKVFIVRFIY